MEHRRMRTCRYRVAVCALGGAFALQFSTLPAQAQWSVCRTDPKVWFQDGAKLDIATVIAADPAGISRISYTVHVPAGMAARQVVYTSGPNSVPETVQVLADATDGISVDVFASTFNGESSSLSFTVHLVSRASVSITAAGTTNLPVHADLPNG